MKKSSLCGGINGADEYEETGKDKEKEIEQELSTHDDVPTDLTVGASGDSSGSKRKSKDCSPSSPEKKVNPSCSSEQSNDFYDPKPGCSGLQQQKGSKEKQQEKEKNQSTDEKKSSKSRKRRRTRRRPAWLIALDDSDCRVFTRAVVNRITDIRTYGYSSTSSTQSRDESSFEQNPTEDATDDTIEGIVIKNLIDLNELTDMDSESYSDSSDTTTGSSASTTTTVISVSSIVQGMSTSDFEQLTVIESKTVVKDDIRSAGPSSRSSTSQLISLSSSPSASPSSATATASKSTSSATEGTASAEAAAPLSKLNSTFFLHDIVEEIEFDDDVEFEVKVVNYTEAETEGDDEDEN